MICFHCCLTRYPGAWQAVRGTVGGGYVLLSPSPGHYLSLQQGLRRRGLTRHVEAKTCLQCAGRLNGTVSSEADFVENHSDKMNLTLFFPSLIFPFSFSSKRHLSSADKLKFDSEIN